MTTFTIDFTQKDFERLCFVARANHQKPLEFLSENVLEILSDTFFYLDRKEEIETIEEELLKESESN